MRTQTVTFYIKTSALITDIKKKPYIILPFFLEEQIFARVFFSSPKEQYFKSLTMQTVLLVRLKRANPKCLLVQTHNFFNSHFENIINIFLVYRLIIGIMRRTLLLIVSPSIFSLCFVVNLSLHWLLIVIRIRYAICTWQWHLKSMSHNNNAAKNFNSALTFSFFSQANKIV